MKLLVGMFLAGTCLAFAPAQAATLDADRKDCGQSQNPDKAISGCTGLIARSAALALRERALAYKNRGNAHAGRGEHDLAIADYDAAISLDPRDQELKDKRSAAGLAVDRASCLQALDRDLQIRGCTAVLARQDMQGASDQAWAFKNRAAAYVAKGEPDLALADYGAWIRHEPEAVAAYVARAEAYVAKGDFDHGIADFDQAVRLDPNDKSLRDKRLSAAFSKGDYDLAIAACGARIRLDGNDKEATGCRARAFFLKGDFARALADYDQALRIDPADSQLLGNRIFAALAINDLGRALADIEQLRRAGGFNSGFTVFMEEIVLWRSGKPSQLRAHTADIDMQRWEGPIFKAWLGELSPQLALTAAKANSSWSEGRLCDATFLLGAREIIKGDRAAGLEQIQCYAAGGPGAFNDEKVMKAILVAALTAAPGAALTIGPVVGTAVTTPEDDLRDCKQQQDRDLAVAACTRSIARGDSANLGYSWRATAYRAKGDFTHAIADYDAMIRLNPGSVAAIVSRSYTHTQNGDPFHALADAEMAIRLDAKSTDAYLARGNAYRSNGNYDRAIADADQAISLNPKLATAVALRGQATFFKGERDKALVDYDQAISLNSRYGAAYGFRAIARFVAGELDRAMTDFDFAILFEPKNPYPLLYKEITLLRSGRTSQLRASLTGIDIEQWPGPVIKAWLGDMPPQAALDAARDGNGKLQREKLCLANFFLGEREIAKGDRSAGLRQLQQAADACPSYTNALGMAKAELAVLAKAPAIVAVATPSATSAPVIAQPVAVPVEPIVTAPIVIAPIVTVPVAKAEPVVTKLAPVVPAPAPCASLGKRVALVIGNSAYPQAAALANPVNDATDIAAVLRDKLCFNVIEAKDATLAVFQKKIGAFAEAAFGADVALFYYAGHGMQFQQTNYLMPVDATMENEYDAIHSNISAQDVVSLLEPRAKVTLVFLDACRTNPIEDGFRRKMAQLGRGGGESRGLAPMASRSAETLVVFATRPNQQAADGAGRNSPFTEAFMANITIPGQDIEKVMRDVTAAVRAKTNGQQVPERLSGLEHDLTLVPLR